MDNKNSFRKNLASLAETILSAVVVVLLYIVYIPFSIIRGLVSRQLINEFFRDALYLLDSMKTGLFIKKHKL